MTLHLPALRRALTMRAAMMVIVALAIATTPMATRAAEALRFGVDSQAVPLAKARGLNVSFATFWLGSWTQKYGYYAVEQELKAAASRDVTMVIHWWYWGDDISPSCVENGCMDARNELRKDKATWSRMSEEIARLIARTVGTRETIVIIETEFNKHGIETYEPFDGYLKEQIDIFKRHGNIKTVVGFGNWGKSNWSRFDRAAAAADYVGVQLLRSSVRDASIYLDAVDTLVTSAQHLHTTFGKPALVTDLALSSYPSTSYETYQDVVFDELFRRSSELKDAGVRAILYRMLSDDPTFDTSNYHGIAERHWGLLRADGSAKPAFSRVVSGLNAENTPPTSGTPPTTPPRKGKTKTARNVKAAAHGRSITVEWDAPADTTGVTGYVLEAGSASGAADLAVVPSAARSLTAANVPDGTYYLRVRPIVDGETGAASDEVTTTVTASPPCVRPPAPSLSVALAGTLVTLRWTTSAAQPATAYSLEVGSSPGQTNLLRTTVAGGQSSLSVTAPLGTYFVRLAAVNACGAGAASNEVVVSVIK